MSPPASYRGLPVSEGVAVGEIHLADAATAAHATPEQVRAAFAAVAADRSALADRLRAAGRDEAADIVGVGALIAADPALVEPAAAAAGEGTEAGAAVHRAAAAQAAVLAALSTPELAERAADVREVARAVVGHLAGLTGRQHLRGDFILVRQEVGAADLIELTEAGLAGAVSVTGGASSHAAIVARGLGVPMLTGVDPAILTAPAGQPAILDAGRGELIVSPSPPALAAALAAAGTRATGGAAQRQPAQPSAEPLPEPLPVPRTRDGRQITVLCNAASAAEARLGLAAGAAGVGLLRTEIPFITAPGWPAQPEHYAQLEPVLGLLGGRGATVRLLDFSGDKVPPFLAGEPSGLAALLAHPTALADQLRAVLEAGKATGLGVLIPMVSTLAEVARVKRVLAGAAAALGATMPKLGIMVELAATAAAAEAFTPEVDFFSIGTNDLTGDVLGLGRRDPRARPALAADPRVLALVARVVAAARAGGVSVSVCGDAAADPAVAPLLVGLGVDVLSVPAAQVGRVRSLVRDLDARSAAALADAALRTATVAEVWELVRSR